MSNTAKIRLSAILLVLVAILLFAAKLWQPQRQIELHQQHLLERYAAKKWKRVAPMIAEDYSDRWGWDKERVLRESREAMRHFFHLTIIPNDQYILLTPGGATVTASLTLEGGGTALAEQMKNEVNRIRPTMVFHWHRQSWKPWDWILVKVESTNFNPDRYRF